MPAPRFPRVGRSAPLVTAALLATLVLALPAAAQRPSPVIAMSVPGGPAGTEVTLHVAGLTPGLRLQVGFGGLSTNHEILGTGEADSNGDFELTTRIPDWVERHRVYRFFLAYAGAPPAVISDPFIATAAQGFVRVAGSVSAASPGCAQVRGFDETVYTLLGNTGALQAGARVVVEGTVGGPEEGKEAAPNGCGSGPAVPVRVQQVLPG